MGCARAGGFYCSRFAGGEAETGAPIGGLATGLSTDQRVDPLRVTTALSGGSKGGIPRGSDEWKDVASPRNPAATGNPETWTHGSAEERTSVVHERTRHPRPQRLQHVRLLTLRLLRWCSVGVRSKSNRASPEKLPGH